MSNPYAALCDSSEGESGSGNDHEPEERDVIEITNYYNSTSHEGGMKVQLDIGMNAEFPFTNEDISTTCKVISQIGMQIALARVLLTTTQEITFICCDYRN